MLRVRDLMTRDVISLSRDASLDSAAWSLASGDVSGAPVRDRQGHVIGVLSRTDLADPSRNVAEAPDASASVGDVMTAGVWAVHPDAPALDAVKLMVDKSIHRVIVVRGPGKLEGIVTAMDVMRALVDGYDFHTGSRAETPRVPKREEVAR